MSRSLPLTSALLRQLVIVAFIPVLVTLLFLLWVLFPLLEQEVTEQQQTLARVVADKSIEQVATAEEEIQFLLRSWDAIRQENDAHTIAHEIQSFVASTSLFDALYVLDDARRITAISVKNKHQKLANTLYLGADLAQSELLKLEQTGSTPYWSNAYLSLITARLTIAHMVPLEQGLLVAEIAVDRLPRVSRSLLDDGILVMILDQHGQLIGHPDPEIAQQHHNLSNLPFYQQKELDLPVSAQFRWDGESYFGTAVKIERLTWTIIVAIEENKFYDPLRRTLQSWLAAIALVLIISVLVAYFRARSFSENFEFLTQQAADIAQGDYETQAQQSEIDEFSQLSRNLQVMVQAIRQRELLMQTREAQLRETLESTPNVAIQWFDAKNRIQYWNAASENLFGFSSDEALEKRMEHLILAPKDAAEFNNSIGKVRQHEHNNQFFELAFVDRQGNPGEMIGSVFSIPNPEGEPIIVSMAIDITRQRQAENHIRRLNLELESRVHSRTQELQHTNQKLQQALDNLNATMTQLVQSEKLAALGSLVAGISHELNTPIGNALMAASTLQDFADEFRHQLETGTFDKTSLKNFMEDASTASQITRRNLEKAAELISSFKQVAVDQSSSQKRSFALKELVDEILVTLRPVTRRSPIEISVDIDGTIILDSYPGPLGQILTNLINNALIHGFEDADTGLLKISAREEALGIYLEVEDNGKGVPSEHISKLFEPFFTTRFGQGGSGLGLHIVHNLVTEVLNGQIRVQSEPGKYTRFTIFMPTNPGERAATQ